MKKTYLAATLQKSYYKKAYYREAENGFIILTSYNTDVLMINPGTAEIYRLWNGWSSTTQKHVNDFLKLFGYSTLSKKEWLSLPCESGEAVYNVYISTGWTTHKCPALLTEEEAEKEVEKIEKNNAGRSLCVWYE